MIKKGDIVKNLIADEAVTIDSIKKLASKWSIHYTGVSSKRDGNVIIDSDKLDALVVVATVGQTNFTGDPERFLLYAECERIRCAYQFDPLFAINCSVVDPLPHQVEAVYKFMLPQPRIRFLLADDTGAGKTIMTGLLVKELMMRGAIQRVLIVTPGGLTKQWQEDEMSVKFNLSFKLVNREVLSAEPNVFQTSDRIITSIDFVCRDDVMRALSSTTWDMIVFDEAHKLSAYEYGQKLYKSKRYDAALALSRQCEHILLLTATPHRGREDTFKRLMQLLDEDIFATSDITTARVRETTDDGVNKFFIRRLKEDMRDWDGHPLYMKRSTATVSYQLTPDEKHLYDSVTQYLQKRKAEAASTKNVHVSLAMQVMQRRLTSSIYAIRTTLRRRYLALQSLADELARNPSLWKQRPRIGDDSIESIDNIDDLYDLDDEERESLDNIMSDPRKLRLFTTATRPQDITNEAAELKTLFNMADELYKSNTEEQKYKELRRLLTSQNIISGEKLVIFTEHKDTLNYLKERLANSGYTVGTIHGGMSVDERREEQGRFMAGTTQILICTDAAGEGINLQKCRVLINWDIPWNPNRLEQRMGRIHRYGQTQDVVVFNMVAANTREGNVLETLLTKLDVIRTQLGDDRVYDVIQDVFKGIPLNTIIASVFNGDNNELNRLINKSNDELTNIFLKSINNKKRADIHTQVNYRDALSLRNSSYEQRLQPLYIRHFFEKAFRYLGGHYVTDDRESDIYRITTIPNTITQKLKENYNIIANDLTHTYFFFDKHKFLHRHFNHPQYSRAHYINPGNPLFDALADVIRNECRSDMLQGTILVSPDDNTPSLAFYVKSTICDNRKNKDGTLKVANEEIALVKQNNDGTLTTTSPDIFINMAPPKKYAKTVHTPQPANHNKIIEWTFEHITEPMLCKTEQKARTEFNNRRHYLEAAFNDAITEINTQINAMQGQEILHGTTEKLTKRLQAKETLAEKLRQRKKQRLNRLNQATELLPQEPEVMGCAYIVPLSKIEYENLFGMKRDDNIEKIAMNVVMNYERQQGRTPEDVSANNTGYDIRSTSPNTPINRYIEVKGRANDGGIMLSLHEYIKLAQIGNNAWLYIVTNCAHNPVLHIINNPANVMSFNKIAKDVEYFLPQEQWKQHEQHKL